MSDWVGVIGGYQPDSDNTPASEVSPVADQKTAGQRLLPAVLIGALGGIRTPNLLIRSQMLYPLSYERPLPVGAEERRSS